jgi:hypothetical protein
MDVLKIKCAVSIIFISILLIFYSGVALSESISEKEVRQAKKEQRLSGYFFQDSTSKKWFLQDREGDTYKFDEDTRKWVKIGEPSASISQERKDDSSRANKDDIVIRDKYYVAVKNLKLFQQPERSAREVGSLEFRTKVEKLAENEDGWMQVRQRETKLTGWVFRPRWNLEKYPLQRPKTGGGSGPISGPRKGEKSEEKPEAKPEPM